MFELPLFGPTRRIVLASFALVALVVASVGVALAPLGGVRADRLAWFRRRAFDKEFVELVGENAAIDGVNCFLDVDQAYLRLMNAAAAIPPTVKKCKVQDTARQRRACSSVLNAVIYNFIFTGGMIARVLWGAGSRLTRVRLSWRTPPSASWTPPSGAIPASRARTRADSSARSTSSAC
mmetsp:Transcript_79638/g.215379  ORF Transcript_79638/g.215379 Transcript_79638/m.215379 type:complete len:179 (-) Transcript_79638:400-936(-)